MVSSQQFKSKARVQQAMLLQLQGQLEQDICSQETIVDPLYLCHNSLTVRYMTDAQERDSTQIYITVCSMLRNMELSPLPPIHTPLQLMVGVSISMIMIRGVRVQLLVLQLLQESRTSPGVTVQKGL